MTVAYDSDDMARLIETSKNSPSVKDDIYNLTGDHLQRFMALLQTVRSFVSMEVPVLYIDAILLNTANRLQER